MENIRKMEAIKEDIYVTIAGMNFRYGTYMIEKNMEKKEIRIKLVKEHDNKFDNEAIKAELKPFGTIGYVANSVHTVIGECYSAGRLYDKIGESVEAVAEYVTEKGVICRVDL